MTPRAQLPPIPPSTPLLTDDQRRMLNRLRPESSYSPQTGCRTCGGTKVFRWYSDPLDKGEVVEYDCPCIDQYLLYRWLAYSGIYDQYMRLGWGDVLDLDPETARQVVDYVDNREAYFSRGVGLVFTGGRGTGKTLLGNLLVKDLISHGVGCYVTTFQSLIDEFAKGWRDREISQWFHRRVTNAPVLLVDDLGREKKQEQKVDDKNRIMVTTSLAENTLETIIRYRVGNNMPTLITTNLTETEVAEGYGGHTMSLLSEKSVFVSVPGGDSRLQINQRTLDEIRLRTRRPVVIG